MLKHHVLLYDGDCSFCRRWVSWIARRDRNARILCLPSSERRALADLPAIPDEDLDRAMHLVSPTGQVSVGAAAIPSMLRQLDGWSWLASLFRVPGVPYLADRVYSMVARNRHRLGCGSPRCLIGQPR